MEFKAGMTYNDLKAQEANGSMEPTNLIEQVGAQSQYKPRAILSNEEAIARANQPAPAPMMTPEKIEQARQTLASIRSQLKRDGEK